MLITPTFIRIGQEELNFTDSSYLLFTQNSISSDNTFISLPNSETLKLTIDGIEIKDDTNSNISIPIKSDPTQSSNFLISQKRVGNNSQTTPLNIPVGTISINALIVAGGGGGSNNGGGGGAGQVIKKTYSLDPLKQYKTNYIIGNGGSSEIDGQDTIINIIDSSGVVLSTDTAQGGKAGVLNSGGNGGGGDGQIGKGEVNGNGGIYDTSVNYGRGGSTGKSGQKGVVILDYISGPSEPLTFSATLLEQTSLSLGWDYPLIPSGTINKYTLYLPNNRIVDFTKNINNSTSYSYIIKNLIKGNSYDLSLSASNQYAEGAKTKTTFKIPTTVPSQPTSLKAVGGNGQITLSWMPPSDNGGLPILDYKIYNNNVDIGSTTSNSFVVSGIVNNQTYNFSVSTKNLSGYGPTTPSISCVPSEIQDAPQNLIAIPGNGQVKLEWTSPNNLNQYKIYRERVEIATSNNNYLDTDLINGNTYQYQIKLVGGNQISSILAMPISNTPDTPTGLSATSGIASVSLSWNSPYNGGSPITEYKVYRDGVEIATTSSTTYTDSGITENNYNYSVSAINSIGEGSQSSLVLAKPNTASPDAPIGVKAKRGNGRVTLSWKDPQNNGSKIMGYKIFRDGIEIATSITPNYTDTGLTNGISYNYTIKAINSVGNSNNSTSVSSIPSTTPSAPIGLISSVSDKQVSLSWSAPPEGGSPITGYKIYLDGFEIATTDSSTTYNNINLINGRSYNYTVAAINNLGVGTKSSSVVAIPSTLPSPPTNLKATSGDSIVILSWDSSLENGGSPITGYKIYNGDIEIDTTSSNISNYKAINLTNGTTYNFSVSSVNASGKSARTSLVSTIPTTIPGQPRSLTTTRGNGRLNLSWVAPSNDGGSTITGYKIFRDGVEIGTSNTTSYSDLNLINGRNYNFTIVAVNNNGSGTQSSISDTPATFPGAPQNLIALKGNSQVRLSWNEPLDNGGASVTSYKIYRNGVEIDTTTSTSYTSTQLTNGTTYNFSVASVNLVGTSPQSSSVSATPLNIPSTVRNIKSTRGNSQLSMSWDPPLDDGGSTITLYKIYRGGIQIATSVTPSYTRTGLANGTSYTFAIVAVNSEGNGSESSVSDIPGRPYPPKNIQTSRGNRQITLSWTAPSDSGVAITGYKIYIDGSEIETIPNTSTTYTATGLSGSTTYNFTVIAINGVGNGDTSSVSSTPATIPDAPTELTAKEGNLQVTLSWKAPDYNGGSAITEYKIYDGDTEISTSTSTSKTVTGLSKGTQYNFTVAAVNDVGKGIRSSPMVSLTAVTIPGQPSAISAIRGDAKVTLSWFPPYDGGSTITGYKIYRVYSGGSDIKTIGNSEITIIGNKRIYTDTDIVNGTSYSYTAAAVNSVGTGPESSSSPSNPTDISVKVEYLQLTFSWKAPEINGGSDITGYKIYREGLLIETIGNTTSYTDKNLSHQLYNYTVSAVNVVQTGQSSSAFFGKPFTLPSAPLLREPLFPDSQKVHLSWFAPYNGGSAITEYKIYRGGLLIHTTLNGDTFYYADDGLQNGTTYSYTVAAVNEAGPGPLSNQISATTPVVLSDIPTITNVKYRYETVVFSWGSAYWPYMYISWTGKNGGDPNAKFYLDLRITDYINTYSNPKWYDRWSSMTNDTYNITGSPTYRIDGPNVKYINGFRLRSVNSVGTTSYIYYSLSSYIPVKGDPSFGTFFTNTTGEFTNISYSVQPASWANGVSETL
jgi:titin